MPESNMHRQLVNQIYQYICSIVPEDYSLFVCADLDNYERPVATDEGFIPDVQYCYKNMLVLGEAKTKNDYFTSHSRSQMISYVNKACSFGDQATLVIGVPWQLVAQVKNDFLRYRKRFGFSGKIVVIDDFKQIHTL